MTNYCRKKNFKYIF